MTYSDSHCHLVDYPADKVKSIVSRMAKENVEFALSVAVDLKSSEGTIKLAETYPQIKAAVGFHPWFSAKLSEQEKKAFEKLASSKYVKALGEIGLDFEPPLGGPPPADKPDMKFPDNMPPLPMVPSAPEVQIELFSYELSVAKKLGLPVNVHCQGGAHQSMMEILRKPENAGIKGVAHSFDGGVKEIKDWLELGFYVTIGARIVHESPDDELTELVNAVPLEKLIVETDANPNMSPGGPLDVVANVQKLAAVKGISAEVIGNITTENLKRILNIK